ncbi:MAG: glycolate oxidase subunit GlcF [Bauldia sp.]
MRTEFAPEQLADPRMAASEKILHTCVHCGFCNATCPTYLLLGDELDGPRGRIYLMKDMLENQKPASKEVVTHVDRCLSCLSCMSTCPSGVHYMHLVDHARAYIEETYTRSWHDRLMRRVLAAIVPYPGRFRLALRTAGLGRPFRPILRRLPWVGARMDAMLDLAPRQLPAKPRQAAGDVYAPQGERRKRVALLMNCTQPVLNPGINEATVRLLNRLGVEVVFPKGEGCCGALVHHMGHEKASHDAAARNVDAWTREIQGDGLDAIIITASGCGTTIKDYGFMFRADPAYAEKAARVSALAMDVTEFLATLDFAPAIPTGLTVAYHSACSMQHGQQIKDGPKKLLARAGFKVRDVPEGHICCGSAGVYNILQPEIAGRLRNRKVDNIQRVSPDVIATGNIGCMVQIDRGQAERGIATPIVHTVDLLDWATGGPMPEAIRKAGRQAAAGAAA